MWMTSYGHTIPFTRRVRDREHFEKFTSLRNCIIESGSTTGCDTVDRTLWQNIVRICIYVSVYPFFPGSFGIVVPYAFTASKTLMGSKSLDVVTNFAQTTPTH